MVKFKVQTWIRLGRTIYLDVYVKGINPRMQARELTKKYAFSKGYGVNPDIGFGNNRETPCDQYDKHLVNCIYDGDWYGHDELLYKGDF